MNATDSFYITAAIVLIISGIFFCLAMYQLRQTLQTIQRVAEDVKNTTHDISSLRENLKYGVLSVVGKMIGTLGSGIRGTLKTM